MLFDRYEKDREDLDYKMASANTKRNNDADPRNLYNTLPDAVESAVKAGVFEDLKQFWDPCNGLGRLSDALEAETGVKCGVRSLLYDYDRGDDIIDFLDRDDLGADLTAHGVDYEHIVFNPPFPLTSGF